MAHSFHVSEHLAHIIAFALLLTIKHLIPRGQRLYLLCLVLSTMLAYSRCSSTGCLMGELCSVYYIQLALGQYGF